MNDMVVISRSVLTAIGNAINSKMESVDREPLLLLLNTAKPVQTEKKSPDTPNTKGMK